jgi:hypothetical protein
MLVQHSTACCLPPEKGAHIVYRQRVGPPRVYLGTRQHTVVCLCISLSRLVTKRVSAATLSMLHMGLGVHAGVLCRRRKRG